MIFLDESIDARARQKYPTDRKLNNTYVYFEFTDGYIDKMQMCLDSSFLIPDWHVFAGTSLKKPISEHFLRIYRRNNSETHGKLIRMVWSDLSEYIPDKDIRSRIKQGSIESVQHISSPFGTI